jgi:hypothetical protein
MIGRPKAKIPVCCLCLRSVGYGLRAIVRITGIPKTTLKRNLPKTSGLRRKPINLTMGRREKKTWDRFSPARVASLQKWAFEREQKAIREEYWVGHHEAVKWEARIYYAKNSGRIYRRIMASPQQKLRTRIRTRVYKLLKGTLKSAPTLELLGCDIDFLKLWLESQFKPGMTRWRRSGWPTPFKLIAQSNDDRLYWRELSESEVKSPSISKASPEDRLLALVPPLEPIGKDVLRTIASTQGERFVAGVNAVDRLLKSLLQQGKVFEWQKKRAKTNPLKLIARSPQPAEVETPTETSTA